MFPNRAEATSLLASLFYESLDFAGETKRVETSNRIWPTTGKQIVRFESTARELRGNWSRWKWSEKCARI